MLSLQSVEQKKKIVKYRLTRGSQEITEKFNLGIEIVHGWFTERGDSILCQYTRMLSNVYSCILFLLMHSWLDLLV